MSTVHVVVGAGPLGLAVARDLTGRGKHVRLLSRSGSSLHPDVEHLRVDATSSAELNTALRGAAVVYQCAQPAYHRWAEEFPALQNTILEATVRAGADLVIADNLYMYGNPNGAVITEASLENPVTKKGRVRKAMADAALDAHRSGRLRVTFSRPSNYFGPGHDQSSKAIFGAAVHGKSMRFFGSMDAPHSLSFFPDAARAMATLGTSDTGWGSVWIPPVQPPITQQEFAARVWDAAGNDGAPRITVVGRHTLAAIGMVVPVVREAGEMLYEYTSPFVVDSSRFERTFDAEPTSLADAITTTLAAYADRQVSHA